MNLFEGNNRKVSHVTAEREIRLLWLSSKISKSNKRNKINYDGLSDIDTSVINIVFLLQGKNIEANMQNQSSLETVLSALNDKWIKQAEEAMIILLICLGQVFGFLSIY